MARTSSSFSSAPRIPGVCGFVLFISVSVWSWATIATLVLAVVLVAPAPAHAYIPAQATNQTDVAQAAGLNFSDVSKLKLQWYGDPIGVYEGTISYQLVGADSTGISKVRLPEDVVNHPNECWRTGALVHFSEDKLPNGTTTTPWIALVSCDANSTNASMEDDIFTLARDRGAVAALLYSVKSVSCYINTEYSNPANFDQVMDIFATQSLSSSNIIESQFTNVLGNSSKYYWFSPSLLNDSASGIETAIVNNTIRNTGYLFATLTASNATDNTNSSSTGTTTSTDGDGGGSDQSNQSTNTSLAMIILYAITGCVSALFCIVIISGAIRAIRHPERYGPRSADAFGGPPGTFGPQSRARGLTRAILDTFPVVKFGRTDSPPEASAFPKDIESADGEPISPVTTKSQSGPTDGGEVEGKTETDAVLAAGALPTLAHTPGVESDERQEDPLNRASSSADVPQVVPRPPKPAAAAASGSDKEVVPDAIGRETCPICIVDFEEGDDLRVLPCEGHHRFHRECVDQWLLELSSSCPICRQDFHALQTMMSAGEEGDTLEPPHPLGSSRPISSAAARFSRYLRAARHRRQRRAREDPDGYDATNPPLPLAPRTMLHM
ncbi:hypothetical protein L227DRAFT_511251 [Lentinus tigrinus ALCF2SS1-6]|uniref:RING-type domain-containing protein n=1 Tax=Lentinus tigrinus ALCF2SS1-6 TaxID=1328759 RepID=A0A5C2RSZ3_9APHY|nr:hypothetical protein L227DRAFT_511251 [Lentinus tigrinus ALCF2SS1-6]